MYYCNIKTCDIANGPGVRVSLFVSGCRNHCKGCFQPETWGFTYGTEYTEDTQKEILQAINKPYIKGLSVLGGDPFEPENEPFVLSLCKEIKEKYPDKTIWVYTGYYYEDLKSHELFKYIDVLVDSPFIEELKDITLRFRGSSNQRIIDVKSGELWSEDERYTF